MAGWFHLVRYLIFDNYQPQRFKVQERSYIQLWHTLSPHLGLILSDFYNHIYILLPLRVRLYFVP